MVDFATLASQFLTGGAGQSAGLETSSTQNINLVGNSGPNIGEILQQLNSGAATNGSFPTLFPASLGTPKSNLPGAPFRRPGEGGFNGGGLFGFTMNQILIGGAGVLGLLLFLRRRKS